MRGSGGTALRSLGSVGSVGAIEAIDGIDRIDVSVGVTVGGFLDGCYGDARVRCAPLFFSRRKTGSFGELCMKLTYPCYMTKAENGDVILECFAPSVTTFGTLDEAVADMQSIVSELIGEALEKREPLPLPETDASHEGERIDVTVTVAALEVDLVNSSSLK